MEFVVRDSTVAGDGGAVLVRDYLPAVQVIKRPLLWVHGGGWFSGGLDQRESDAPARAWASAGRWVRTIDYRLAPRISWVFDTPIRPGPGRFPAGLDDVVAVIEALRAEADRTIDLGGASAGANLAAAAALRLRDEGRPLPCRLALAYGTFHPVLPTGSPVYANLHGPLARFAFNPKMYRRMALNYVGDVAQFVPGYAFPGGSDLAGLPPTLVMDAENDRLHASGARFADELRAAGVTVREAPVPATHGFFDRPRDQAFAQGVVEIRTWLEGDDLDPSPS